MVAGDCTRDPLALARRHRDLPIERQGELQGNPGSPKHNSRKEAGCNGPGCGFTDSGSDLYPSRRQPSHALPCRTWIRINHRRDHPGYARRNQGISARRPPVTDMGAGLKTGVDRCTMRSRSGVRQGHGLAVRTATRLGRAAPNHDTVTDDDTSNGRIRSCASDAAFRQRQCRTHPALIIGAHAFGPAFCAAITAASSAFWAFSAAIRAASSIACCAFTSASVRLSGQLWT